MAARPLISLTPFLYEPMMFVSSLFSNKYSAIRVLILVNIDDLTALVIGLRYTKQLTQSKIEVKEATISSSELEEKRLHAMEQLYGKGEVHDK